MKPAQARPRIVLADDNAAMLAKVSSLLKTEFDIAAVVSNGEEAVRAASDLAPDLIILDIAMPVLNGLDAARRLRRMGIATKLLFLTIQQDSEYIFAAKELQASYVLKTSMASELLPAIIQTLDGGNWISRAVQASSPSDKPPMHATHF